MLKKNKKFIIIMAVRDIKEYYIMKISPINTLPKPTKILKMALPTASALGVLAGSSMGPQLPRHDVVHIPGSSVEDPFIDQVEYFANKAIDLGKDAGNAILDGAERLIDKIAGIGGSAVAASDIATNSVLDSVDAGDAAADVLENLLDAGSPAIDTAGDIINEVIESTVDVLF